MAQLTLWSVAHLAKVSQPQESGKGWMGLLDSSGNISDFYRKLDQSGLSGKTCRGLYRLEALMDQTSSSYFANGMTSGIMSHGAFLTLSTLEYPKDAVESSLSDVLMTGDVPQKYFLSQKACEGILRRAEKRGKKIPEALRIALEQQAATGTEVPTQA